MIGSQKTGRVVAIVMLSVAAAQLANGEAVAQPFVATKEAPKVEAPYVKAIRGRLFLEGKDQMDTEDLFSGRANVWNTILSSNVMLIFVDIGGRPIGHDARGSLELKARAGGQVFYSTAVQLKSFFTDEGQTLTVPFVVYRTGCVPVDIVATVRGTGGPVSTKKVTAAFNCGE